MTDDWTTLASTHAPITERLEALARIVQDAASDDAHGHQLDVLCTAFVDEAVRSGKLAYALDEAARLARERRAAPARPDTGGPRAQGPADLICEPSEVRSAIPPILYGLVRRSHASPELARWLFEAAKLWPNERRYALAGLSRARVEPEMLADGIDALVTFASARPDPGGDILRDTARAWLPRPAWMLALIDRVARDRAAADALADSLYGDDLATAPAPPDASADAMRREWLHHATHAPSGARAVALGVLATLTSDDGLEAALVAALTDGDAHGRVIEAAARLALSRRVWSRAVLDAAERCQAARPADDRLGMQVAEALHAAVHSGTAALAPPPSATAGARLSIVEGTFRCSGLAFAGALAITGYRRALIEAPQSDWRTDEDEIGLAVVGPDRAARHAAPVRFAARMTGASGARRAVDLAGVLDGRAILVITSPFSDERGWGNDNYALGCDPTTGAWVTYRAEAGKLVVAGELTEPVTEAELPALCFGEAIVWLDAEGAHVVADGTPYHLDDYEIEDAVSAAAAARRQARGDTSWSQLELGGDTPWSVRGDAGAVARTDLATELAAAWPAYRREADFSVTARAQGAALALTIEQRDPTLRTALLWRAGAPAP